MHRPFSRSIAFAAALAQIATLPMLMQEAARMELGPYVSRSKGLGRRSGRKQGNPGTDFHDRADHFHAYRSHACDRRMRQIQRGTLTASNGLTPSNVAA